MNHFRVGRAVLFHIRTQALYAFRINLLYKWNPAVQVFPCCKTGITNCRFIWIMFWKCPVKFIWSPVGHLPLLSRLEVSSNDFTVCISGMMIISPLLIPHNSLADCSMNRLHVTTDLSSPVYACYNIPLIVLHTSSITCLNLGRISMIWTLNTHSKKMMKN